MPARLREGLTIGGFELSSPRVLGVAGGVLILLGLIPGMPHAVFLIMGSLLGWAAWLMFKQQNQPAPVS